MEFTKIENAQLEIASDKADAELLELADLQLAIVGGGIGDVGFA
jgi:hypothetical protein